MAKHQNQLEITDGELDDMRELAKTNPGMRDLLEKALAYSKLAGPPVKPKRSEAKEFKPWLKSIHDRKQQKENSK